MITVASWQNLLPTFWSHSRRLLIHSRSKTLQIKFCQVPCLSSIIYLSSSIHTVINFTLVCVDTLLMPFVVLLCVLSTAMHCFVCMLYRKFGHYYLDVFHTMCRCIISFCAQQYNTESQWNFCECAAWFVYMFCLSEVSTCHARSTTISQGIHLTFTR